MHWWSRKVCQPGEWSFSGRRRVLVEGPDAWAWEAPLAEAGYEVIACRGPNPEEQRPLLVFGACATAAAAHEIASDVPEVATALRERYPLTPLRSSPAKLLR